MNTKTDFLITIDRNGVINAGEKSDAEPVNITEYSHIYSLRESVHSVADLELLRDDANKLISEMYEKLKCNRDEFIKQSLLSHEAERIYLAIFGDNYFAEVKEELAGLTDEQIVTHAKNLNAYKMFKLLPYVIGRLTKNNICEFEQKLRDLRVAGKFGMFDVLRMFGEAAGHTGDFCEMPMQNVYDRLIAAEIISSIDELQLEYDEGYLVINGIEWFSKEERKFFTEKECIKLIGKHIAIPDGYTDIAPNAFVHTIFERKTACSHRESPYKSIKIPNSVKRIWDYGFSGCNNLEKITLPDSITSIGDCAFRGCTSLLEEVRIPDGITSLGHGLFSGCYTLSNVIIPDSVTVIGDRAFSGCHNLMNITMPDGLKTIGDHAFDDCGALGIKIVINIPESVVSIGDGAFRSCESLKTLTIPKSVEHIGDNAFGNCYDLEQIEVVENNANYKSVDNVLFNKNMTTLIYCPEKRAGKYDIPDTVTEICSHAFEHCRELTTVTIPDSVEIIGDEAFSMCISIEQMAVPGKVKRLSKNTFSYCRNLSSVTLSVGLEEIGEGVFYGCDALTEIAIPSSVTSIGCNSFKTLTSREIQMMEITIICEKDSFAHMYAQVHKIDYKLKK